MITRHEVVQAIASIRMSAEEPMRKVRALLELSRLAKKALRSMDQGIAILESDGDIDAARRLSRVKETLIESIEWLRQAAREIGHGKSAIGYSYAPRSEAYPHQWDSWRNGLAAN